MISIEIALFVYNLPLGLIITPLEVTPLRLDVKAVSGDTNSMILKYLPNNSWTAEKCTMKFFTKKYVEQLGLLIQNKKPEWFHAY